MAGEDGRTVIHGRMPRDQARATLLARGVELFDERGYLVPVAEVTATFVNPDGKPKTTGWAYQVWPSQAAYWEDVVMAVATRPWIDADGLFLPEVARAALQLPWQSHPGAAAVILGQMRVTDGYERAERVWAASRDGVLASAMPEQQGET